MALSGQTVRAALAAVGAVGNQIRSVDELAAGADGALRSAPAGLTAAGAAAFLATCAVESAWFRTTQEYGTKLSYDPYRGRTFVQLTWVDNYRGFGQWCHAKGLVADPETFVKAPTSLADFRWAWLGAIYYFETHGIWRWANAGDFRAVSQAVNGGNGRVGTSFVPNGWAERQAMYRVFLAVGAALLPSGAAPVVSAAAVLATRRPRGDEMFFQTPEPTAGQNKWDWPTIRVPFAFDPIGGWGGKMIVKVDHGGRGGWIHLLRWWVRDPNWNANVPLHFAQDHPVGASGGHSGSERFVGYGWQSAPPLRADLIEIVVSAPDGVHIRDFYEK